VRIGAGEWEDVTENIDIDNLRKVGCSARRAVAPQAAKAPSTGPDYHHA
jgi:hypothetical protein